MPTASPTKLDIAKAVGVSRTCVSQVLNQIPNARISMDTRRRIMDEARKRGYLHIPVQRQQLATSAIVYAHLYRHAQYKPSISHVWPQVMQELNQLARADDRYMVFVNSSTDALSLEEFYRSIEVIRPLAIVLDGVVPDAVLAEVRRRNLPHVVFGTAAYAIDEQRLPQTNTVAMDYDSILGMIMKWLCDRGCRRIALSCGVLRGLVHSLVFESYRKWVERLNLQFDPALVQFGEDATGAEIFTALGRLGVQHDGIILASVSRAVRALPFLPPSDRGSHRVRSVGVIGSPDLSTDWLSDMAVCGPRCSDMARAIYEVISAELNYQTKKKKHIMVPNVLIEAV